MEDSGQTHGYEPIRSADRSAPLVRVAGGSPGALTRVARQSG